MSRAERGTRSELPRKPRGVASWGTRGEEGGRGARRTGQPGRTAPKRSRFSYLPPAWVPAVSSLASLYFAPVPLLAPQPRAARGGPRSLSPLWVSSASCPVAPRASLGLCPPDDPPCNSSTTGQRPPSLGGRHGRLCRLVGSRDCHVQHLIWMCLESWKLDYPTFSYKWTLRACLEVLAGELSYSYTLDRRTVLLYRGRSSSSTERTASGGMHVERISLFR
ncbi:uncharacterized protein LOC132476780 [Mesoplodon densirostris]|uniref:uncharacterized protein LOC132476780 n=1 Tax=Mesoplodon densirostris TaxID=48708 RepID=UPI0028DC078F|nr:uncharacterized protein LOC132476780 [Mesoplodon densirostris]